MSFDPTRIADSHLLTDRFGGWPSFHDAEVVELHLDRSGPNLVTTVHVFEMTSTVTPSGLYELRNHTLVVLRFSGVAQLQLVDFNHQNALMGLELEDITAHQLEALHWEVSLHAANGMDATFMCRTITVERAGDYQPHASSADPSGTQGGPKPGLAP